MYPRSVHVLQADALFASALQRSDEPSVSQLRQAITAALDHQPRPGMRPGMRPVTAAGHAA